MGDASSTTSRPLWDDLLSVCTESLYATSMPNLKFTSKNGVISVAG